MRARNRLPCALAAVAMCLLAAPGRADGGAHARADCESHATATVLHPSVAMDARAVWLDRRLATWPGVASEGRFRLYHSREGRIAATRGEPVAGADASLVMVEVLGAWPEALARRFPSLMPGVTLAADEAGVARLRELHRGQLVLVREDDEGRVLEATGVQAAGALDDFHASAEGVADLGATVASATGRKSTRFLLWAPSAQRVSVCLYADGSGAPIAVQPMRWEGTTGVWTFTAADDLSGRYYAYLVDVFVRGVGMVRHRVTDPYSRSLSADSRRSFVADLDGASLKPPGWSGLPAPAGAGAAGENAGVEVRSHPRMPGCPRHLAVAEAFDPSPASEGARRIVDTRALVAGLRQAGLRAVMGVALDFTAADGPDGPTLLESIVPGYYQRLDAFGAAERAGECVATATDHRMMAKLLLDALSIWARDYLVDGFRVERLAEQPPALLARLAERLLAETGRSVAVEGEPPALP